MLFVCENNQYATEVPFVSVAGNPDVGTRGLAYGMPPIDLDGNDVVVVYEAARTAVARLGGCWSWMRTTPCAESAPKSPPR